MKLKHRFLGYDEGLQTLGIYDTQNSVWGWTFSVENLPMSRDLQKLGGNLALVGFDRGYFEIDLITGSPTKIVDRWSGVTSARRLLNGNTLLTGMDIEGDGWYSDGDNEQYDYYISFAMHFYGILYAGLRQKEDSEMCKVYKKKLQYLPKTFYHGSPRMERLLHLDVVRPIVLHRVHFGQQRYFSV